jgi:hypothetical protein
MNPINVNPLHPVASTELDEILLLAAMGLTSEAKMKEAEQRVLDLDPVLLPDFMAGLLALSSGAGTGVTSLGMQLGAAINLYMEDAKGVSTGTVETAMMKFQHQITVLLTINAVVAAVLKYHSQCEGGFPAIVARVQLMNRRTSDVLVGRYVQAQNQEQEALETDGAGEAAATDAEGSRA